jgi:hypothetical protein
MFSAVGAQAKIYSRRTVMAVLFGAHPTRDRVSLVYHSALVWLKPQRYHAQATSMSFRGWASGPRVPVDGAFADQSMARAIVQGLAAAARLPLPQRRTHLLQLLTATAPLPGQFMAAPRVPLALVQALVSELHRLPVAVHPTQVGAGPTLGWPATAAYAGALFAARESAALLMVADRSWTANAAAPAATDSHHRFCVTLFAVGAAARLRNLPAVHVWLQRVAVSAPEFAPVILPPNVAAELVACLTSVPVDPTPTTVVANASTDASRTVPMLLHRCAMARIAFPTSVWVPLVPKHFLLDARNCHVFRFDLFRHCCPPDDCVCAASPTCDGSRFAPALPRCITIYC